MGNGESTPAQDRELETFAAHGWHDLSRLSAGWDALADTCGASPFARPGWIEAWWRAFGAGALRLLTVLRGDSLAGVLPISSRPGSSFATSNVHTPQFELLGADEEASALLACEMFASQPALVSLRYLADPEHLGHLSAAAEEAGYTVLTRPLDRFPFVAIDSDWRSYRRSLSGNLRRDVERRTRRLGQLGDVALDVQTTTDRLPEAFRLESAGWKGTSGSAIASRPDTLQFYTEISRWAASRGSLRLCFLRVGAQPIAFHLAIEEGGVYFPLKGGYDPSFAAYSPGSLIIDATLERAFALGLRRYEFLGGADPYKLRWATDSTERTMFQAFAPTPAGALARVAVTYGRPLAKRVQAAIPR